MYMQTKVHENNSIIWERAKEKLNLKQSKFTTFVDYLRRCRMYTNFGNNVYLLFCI